VSIKTIFDIIQTPIFGLSMGFVMYFQFRKIPNMKRPVAWAVAAGVLGAAAYGAWKFLSP
jgi:hypothetical protein